jgi:hypothetical protein
MDIEEQKITYNQLLANYIKEAPGKMFIFEVTKCCFYSTLVYMYKDERIVELYNRVSHHFGTTVVSLHIVGANNVRIPIPLNGIMTVKEFVNQHRDGNQPNLMPIYDLPMPVVYRIHYYDGFHCLDHPVNPEIVT